MLRFVNCFSIKRIYTKTTARVPTPHQQSARLINYIYKTRLETHLPRGSVASCTLYT